MLPTNVMSFVKKMVNVGAEDGLRERSPLRPSSNVQETITQGSPSRVAVVEKVVTSPVPEGADMSHLTSEEITILQKVFEKQQQFEKEEASRMKVDGPKPSAVCRSNACRICLRGLQGVDDVFHVCCECQQKVCEDCSSYSQQGNAMDSELWKCSICRRKQADLHKLHDPEVTSIILQRTASRKKSSSVCNNQFKMGSAGEHGVTPALTDGSMASDGDRIAMTPKLRPKTLDTSPGYSPSSLPNENSAMMRSSIHSQERFKEANKNCSPSSPLTAGHQFRSATSGDHKTGSSNSNDSGSQTPVKQTSSSSSIIRDVDAMRTRSSRTSSSLETEGDRKSSTRRLSPRHGEYYMSDSDGLMQHRLSPNTVRDRCSPRPRRHSPSTSDSSLDDGWNVREPESNSRDQDVHWKRKKSKIKRRTRIQRQRSYHDELEQVKRHPVDSGNRTGSNSNDYHHRKDAQNDDENDDDNDDNDCGVGDDNDGDFIRFDSNGSRRTTREQLLDVPGHSRIYRHHSWDASLSANRHYSSESSDISDVSLDYPGSLDQDELSGGVGGGSGTGTASPFQMQSSPLLKPKSVRKLARKKRVDMEDDYDAEQSATMESSPSPDHLDRYFPPHLDRRTSSEDSDVFKANRGNRKSFQNDIIVTNSSNINNGAGSGPDQGSPSSGNWPRKIPTVEVHVADHEAILTTCESQPIKVEAAIERSNSTSSGTGSRALPKIPNQQPLTGSTGRLASSVALPLPVGCPRTRQSKSVDLTPLCHSNNSDRNAENLLRRSTLSDFENVRIVIDDVDSDRKDRPTMQRKVILSRIPIDGGHRTRGFGMRVVGGKIGEDGKLFAYVVWTVPGGPAEENGIIKGDKILEWDGETLIDRTFEEVCVIMDHSGDEVTLIVEHVIDPRNCLTGGDFIHRRASEGSHILAKDAISGAPMRRKLPQPPSKDNVSGDIQLMLWFDSDQKLLTITVVEADSLPLRNDNLKTPPQAYAKIRLLPDKNKCTFKTPVYEPSSSPTWNENFNYIGVSSEDVAEKFLVVSVWDMVSSKEKVALGEVVVQLKKCELDGRAEWYRLRDGCALTTSASISALSKSLHVPFPSGQPPSSSSSASSPANADAVYTKSRETATWRKRSDFLHSRSLSDDIDDDLALELIGHIVKSTSVDSNLLHPEQAYNRQGRRRSSSGSEKDQSDASTHSCPQSLPSTRKNSFNLEPHRDYASSVSRDSKLRSRSFKMPSSVRPNDHLIRFTKESLADVAINAMMKRNNASAATAAASDRLSRSLSLKVDRRSLSLVNVSTLTSTPNNPDPSHSTSEGFMLTPHDDHEVHQLQRSATTPASYPSPKEYLALPSPGKWSSSSSLSDEDEYSIGKSPENVESDMVISTTTTSTSALESSLHLGPGQMSPKNFTGIIGSNHREIKLGLIITKGFMEIDVICARRLGYSSTGQFPDTYVKMYLKEGDKRMQKKKTRVVRHNMDPQYRQTLTYPAGEVIGRFLLVMVWERQKGFDHNHGIGAAQIDPNKLELNHLVIGWYRLFPMGKIESESNEST